MPFGKTQSPTQDPRLCQRNSIASRKANDAERKANPKRDPIEELKEIQAKALITLRSGKLTPQEISQLTRSYTDAEKLIRVIEGKAANVTTTLRPETKKETRSRQTGPVLEQIETPPEPKS